jgi:hypothetical protein
MALPLNPWECLALELGSAAMQQCVELQRESAGPCGSVSRLGHLGRAAMWQCLTDEHGSALMLNETEPGLLSWCTLATRLCSGHAT